MFGLLACCGSAFAGDLADFNAAVELASGHNRVAIGYLRTGNTDLASIELDRLRSAWSALTARFAGKRPDAFDGNALYGTTLVNISTRLVAADMMLKSGRGDSAAQSLNAIRGDLYELRKSSGIVVLADCVRDANAVADAIMQFNKNDLDWTKSSTRFGIANKASIYGYVLDRCDGIASATVHNSPEFRRLVDGARAGLELIPKAIATRDTNLLHRILIELRSFDNLLAFRFG
ncbi:MAG TPA: hypothetical protein VFC54_04050 [Pseudolabrys sp.]|nr:hypothetical protein [Pseudolabrys sp.]